jgi:hypothetical protein
VNAPGSSNDSSNDIGRPKKENSVVFGFFGPMEIKREKSSSVSDWEEEVEVAPGVALTDASWLNQ